MANYYLVESYAGWFVCYATNKREAEQCGRRELGTVKLVRRATEEEIESYCRQKGIDQLAKSYWTPTGTVREGVEANRQHQMAA